MAGFRFRRHVSDEDRVLNLIFSGGPPQDEEDLEDLEKEIDELDSSQRQERFEAANKRPSIYVKVFEEMLSEVEGFEDHLFNKDELRVINALKTLDYASRYLLVRLLCRNRGRWLRYKHLERYVSEIGEHGIREGMNILAKPLPAPVEIIDLTSDDEDNGPVAGPSNETKPIVNAPKLDYFCCDESQMPVELILDTLDVSDLKALAKDFRLPSTMTRKSDIKAALLKHAHNQTVLPSNLSPHKKGKDKGKFKQTTLSFAATPSLKSLSSNSQEQRLKQLASKRLGKCISVNPDFHLLIRRLCIVFYRCIHMPEHLMRQSLLSEFKKRVYPSYNYKRSNIFETRESLLAFERALEVEYELQAVLEIDDDKLEEETTPQRAVTQEVDMDSDIEEILPPPSALVLRSLKVKAMLEESILPRWRECVKQKDAEQGKGVRPGLDRFEPGFIYTRMVGKGSEALGHLKEYQAEVDILNELLGQRHWRRGRRGRWYERRALVTITYLSKVEGKKRKNNTVLRRARAELVQALEDEDTHIVCRPGLLRRLQKLEKTLKIPEEERAQSEGHLKEPELVEVRASRVRDDPPWARKDKENEPPNGERRWGKKSIWLGDKNEEVDVETRALQDYEKSGYKGFHAETRIVTTIFGLLFWDVIFADVPGAFETKFQVAPLDIAEDSFYQARKQLIDTRLQDIREGKALEIAERHDKTYRSTSTWCVGVRWDLCPKEDLLEIIECFSGASLAMLCELFCEDYSGRNSGVPDLIVWKYEAREVKFVEVKGPGDRPQENQKLWFDALHRADILVELCKVVDLDAKVKRINAKLKRKAEAEAEALSGDEEIRVKKRLHSEEICTSKAELDEYGGEIQIVGAPHV
ncbi:hypothetical protein CYLTODRAFT_389217 [Cylindrobasidium torrendii FP15055 ss-10]|uniref:Fanconi-associated nuclease n=1 Tax=Cylindrobasidium torrendii FP15055 ss-10 TaxID=1314674 RepID=A0A0D7BNA5_9AGAR|nr:hypothetical protein CYLTODRAFT_389217 [Cylindrobasidium torrendii FP15055 ss-10]